MTIPSPLHPQYRRILGLCRWRPTRPLRMPLGASLALDTVTYLRLLPDTPSRVTSPSRDQVCPGTPGRCPCLIGFGFPSSGSRVRTCAYMRSPPISWSCQSHLLDDVTTSPASRRLASARPALAPKCKRYSLTGPNRFCLVNLRVFEAWFLDATRKTQRLEELIFRPAGG